MNLWLLSQIIINLIIFAALGIVWLKLQKPVKDDPRMSRGLQLLTSKIAILEDLSDRTETQVKQLTALMEHKCKEIRERILESEKQLNLIDQATEKSLEVARIFQDRIPHQEIIERQNTIKYVKAAKMAHQGANVDDIAAQIDLPRGEIEFIAKVNRDQLMFSEENLPDWAKRELELGQPLSESLTIEEPPTPVENFSTMFETEKPQMSELQKLGEEFKKALQTPETFSQNMTKEIQSAPQPSVTPIIKTNSSVTSMAKPIEKDIGVRSFQFRRLNPEEIGS